MSVFRSRQSLSSNYESTRFSSSNNELLTSSSTNHTKSTHQVDDDSSSFRNDISNNKCIKQLLTIVASGNAIITELYRLIELVPEPFKNKDDCYIGTSGRDNHQKQLTLDDLIFDFSYFKDSDAYENRIESNDVLKKADEKLCDNYLDILTRFYLTFESIQRYSQDLNLFIYELEQESFVGQSIESLLISNDARQLLVEAYFLLGYMLLTCDNNFEGSLRERLIVSYYRYSSYKTTSTTTTIGTSNNKNSNFILDDTCNLMRATGFRIPKQQLYFKTNKVLFHRPNNYPENFFARLNVNQSFVNMLIAKLQSHDIYNQTMVVFPKPEHRSTALAQQASMLYIILYFCPNILSNQKSRMREITDKFFYDNWILSIHMGELVNLIEAWEPYRAAKESLVQLLDHESISTLVNQYNENFVKISQQMQGYLKEGWLNNQTVLNNHSKILNTIREANVSMRWMLLHRQMNSCWQLKLSKSVYSIVVNSSPNQIVLYKFLQDLSELEMKFSLIYKQVVCVKNQNLQDEKKKAAETFEELIDIFNDSKPMRWIQPGINKRLVFLLSELFTSLKDVNFGYHNARNQIINLLNELESTQESYLDGKNLQVVQLFADTKESLLNIVRALSLIDDNEVLLQSISDFSYAWRIMDSTFTSHMQQIIKENPLKVHSIESTFMKLASAFDNHLLRIQQVESQADLISVSQYYSTKLVSYIRDVLHIIPETILQLLSSIISIQTEHSMAEMPAKVALDNLKEFYLPEKRFQILELTYKVSHYAESMLMMQDTTIGLIRVNSKQLLEDGIRRELVKKMSDSIQNILHFDDSSADQSLSCIRLSQNLLVKLSKLDVVLNGYKNSFEYIQDYLFIYGLRMYQEELNRIIKSNVDLATEMLLNKNHLQRDIIQQQLTLHLSNEALVPIYSSNPLRSSFILRILDEVLKISDPRATIYDEQMSAWYDQKGGREKVLDIKIFEMIASSLSVAGLNAFDQMCSALIVLELQKFDNHLSSIINDDIRNSNNTQSLAETINSILRLKNGQFSNNRQSMGKAISSAIARIAPYSESLINHLLTIGQLQALRSNISYVLSTNCRHEARNLYSCLETLNTILLTTLRGGMRKSSSQQKMKQQNDVQLMSSTVLSNHSDIDAEINAIESDSNNNYNLEDSQLMFELANHLEWIGLSDPAEKIYTLALQSSYDCSKATCEVDDKVQPLDIIFLLLLEVCPKFQFSKAISGFIPRKEIKTFYETIHNIDAQPLFYGLTTFLNHLKPLMIIDEEDRKQTPLTVLFVKMSSYVKINLDHHDLLHHSRFKDLSLVGNMILSMIELARLSRLSPEEILDGTPLPKFLLDTFQFTLCHLNINNQKSHDKNHSDNDN